jgi:hypothetical protein
MTNHYLKPKHRGSIQALKGQGRERNAKGKNDSIHTLISLTCILFANFHNAI